MQTRKLFDLTGKAALVTGGSRGIGLSIAEGLGEMGARVVIASRTQSELDAAVAHLQGQGIEAHAIACDITRPENVAPLVDQTLQRLGTIDILVNNAGTSWVAPAEDYPDKGWQKVMNLCIGAPFMLTREIGRRVMLPRGSGKILNISSLVGSMGNGTGRPGGGHFIGYHAAKGALESLTRGLAVEWGDRNINVNALAPGYIATEWAREFQAAVKPFAIAATPLARFGDGEDIKGVAVFLVSEAARFVTGQVVMVDGGFSAN
ncbi:MAG: SDR family oxidoreductase [Gammaproteobacteria bacterium]